MFENIWKEIESEAKHCVKCDLALERKNVVFGRGNRHSPIMIVYEAATLEDDGFGEASSEQGRQGRLLKKILESGGFNTEAIYITPMVKCHPANDRKAMAEEVEICSQYLDSEIVLVQPRIIVTLGYDVTKYFMGESFEGKKIVDVRGKVYDWESGVKVIPMLPMSYLLRDKSTGEGSPKWLAWQDILMLKNYYDGLKENLV